MPRDRAQWLAEMAEDVGAIRSTVTLMEDNGDKPRAFKYAIKEADRLKSDLYRMAEEVYGISRDVIDTAGPV